MDFIKRYGLDLGFSIALLLMVGISMYYALNIPRFDDFDQTLGLIIKQQDANSFFERIMLLFAERNEHRALAIHFLSWFDYSLFGELDFRRLTFVTNLMYVGFIYLLWKIGLRLDISKKQFIPVFLFLTVPVFVLLNWNSAGLNYIGGVVFSVWSLYQLSFKGFRSVLIAVFLASLAVANFTIGFMTFIAALPFFFTTQKRKHMWVWFGGMIIVILLYMWGYSPESSRAPISNLISAPHVVVFNFLVFWSGPFKSLFSSPFNWYLVIGPLILLVTTLFTRKHVKVLISNPLLSSNLIFALGLGAGIAFFRAELGLGNSVADRYVMFQALLPVFLYLAFVKIKGVNQTELKWIIGLSLLLFGLRYMGTLQNYMKEHKKMSYSFYAFQMTDDPQHIAVKKTGKAFQFLKESKARGIYDYAKVDCQPIPRTTLKELIPQQKVQFVELEEESNNQYYLLSGWAFQKFKENNGTEIYLKLESDQSIHFVPTGYLGRKETHPQVADNGFLAIIDKNAQWLNPGDYHLSVVVFHPVRGVLGTQPLDKVVSIK